MPVAKNINTFNMMILGKNVSLKEVSKQSKTVENNDIKNPKKSPILI